MKAKNLVDFCTSFYTNNEVLKNMVPGQSDYEELMKILYHFFRAAESEREKFLKENLCCQICGRDISNGDFDLSPFDFTITCNAHKAARPMFQWDVARRNLGFKDNMGKGSLCPSFYG